MKRIVDRKIYDTNTATLVASDRYWDGHNFERHGRNTYLYRTPRGAFFVENTTLWQGERDTIEPVDKDEAIRLYEQELTEHDLEYEEAFGIVPEEPEASPGRPPLFDEKMKQVGVYLPAGMIAWLQEQPEGISGTIRSLIKPAMEG